MVGKAFIGEYENLQIVWLRPCPGTGIYIYLMTTGDADFDKLQKSLLQSSR